MEKKYYNNITLQIYKKLMGAVGQTKQERQLRRGQFQWSSEDSVIDFLANNASYFEDLFYQEHPEEMFQEQSNYNHRERSEREDQVAREIMAEIYQQYIS